MKSILKKNQIIIYVIAIMLMTAGYLNYTTKQGENSIQTSLDIEAKDDSRLADIGDATLVSSSDVVVDDLKNETNTENTTNTATNEVKENNIDNNVNQVNNTEETLSNVSNNTEYFTKSKLERDNMYSQMIETYEKILNSSNSLETQKQTATAEITKINQTKNSIMICENLIKTKGFENVVIFVNGESVSVIIGLPELKQEEVAQIQNIISRELNVNAENIHISTK
ncbi:MAG: SpoIIIAH-like family protein [Clostridia bacterium]|nr:SpoIIIAH-like family protein [Clostridia bacterium]